MFGTLRMRYPVRVRGKEECLSEDEWEMVVIPKGVDHLSVASEEVQVILIEPKGTLNTRNVVTEKTKQVLERI
jgi:hypothetical protein